MENTSTTQQHNRITDILHKIQNKEISVHSKTFFRLQWLAFAILVLAICLVSVILCSFILFTIEVTGQPHLIDFGTQGVMLAFFIFPWMLFFVDIFLIMLLVSLTRHTSFGYKIPGIYVLLSVVCIIGVSGYIVESKTTFHKNMLIRADTKRLPLIGSMYQNVRRAPPRGYEIYRGIVIDAGEGFVLVTLDTDREDTIHATTTRVYVRFASSSPQLANVVVGQTVLISGKIIDGQIMHPRLKVVPQLPRAQ